MVQYSPFIYMGGIYLLDQKYFQHINYLLYLCKLK